MDSLGINRKRGDDCLNLNHPTSPHQNPPNFQVSKKPRFSFAHQILDKAVSSSKNKISRMSRYPEAKSPFRREVHAPCRGNLRFGLSSISIQERKLKASDDCEKQEFAREMGSFFCQKYDNFKQSALDALRFVSKDEAVIDLDDKPHNKRTSEDLSSEEVEVTENFKGNTVEDKNVRWSFSSAVTDLKNSDNFRVDDAGKMLDSMSLNRQVLDVSSVEAYRKLLESAEKRTSKLEKLGFDIILNERRLALLREARPLKLPVQKPTKEVPLEPFITLTEEEESEVQRAFSANNRRKVLVTHRNSNIDITGQILQCLRPGAWLNDEVINLYLELLKERETRKPQKFWKCHFFNTFFYKKLVNDGSGYNYKAVRRWTSQRKLGYFLIDCDKIFVPIHKEIHWCLAVINKKDRKFQYLDSLRGMDAGVLNALATYFVEEAKDKSGKDIDVSSWELEFVEALPEQENGYDCGMFMLKYIDFYSRGLGLCFGQEHMPYFRMRTAKEILRLQAD